MIIENVDLFEIENARSMSIEQIAMTFVPTQSFWRLLSRKHNIVLGARGSGKTAIARMLSHRCLKKLDDPRAKNYIQNKSYIGLYVPTRLDWISALRNKPWNSLSEKEIFFQWFLNISICQAFLETTKSCIDCYTSNKGVAAIVEAKIVKDLSKVWLDRELPSEKLTITFLQSIIREIQYNRQKEFSTLQMKNLIEGKVGYISPAYEFDVPLFSPLYIGKDIVSELLEIPSSASWLVIIDEAEFLDEDHQRIINTHMRSFSENVFIKMTTTPYGHYTTETNSNLCLDPGEDFEYVYIDQDKVSNVSNNYGVEYKSRDSLPKMIFDRRANASGSQYSDLSFEYVFGESKLLISSKDDWSIGSELREALLLETNTALQNRARKFFDQIDRGHNIKEAKERFDNTIGRKIGGRLALRLKLKYETKGNTRSDAYSGYAMIERCCDGNPRRFVRIINLMFKNKRLGKGTIRVKLSEQNTNLVTFGKSQLDRALPELNGEELYWLITDAGKFFSNQLHNAPLAVDDYYSIKFTKESFNKHRKAIERGCELGLLYPFKAFTGALPHNEGEFSLAFVLAAHFKVFPRKGKYIDFEKIPKSSKQERKDLEC